jgi:hypothetical protein
MFGLYVVIASIYVAGVLIIPALIGTACGRYIRSL